MSPGRSRREQPSGSGTARPDGRAAVVRARRCSTCRPGHRPLEDAAGDRLEPRRVDRPVAGQRQDHPRDRLGAACHRPAPARRRGRPH
ncbi:hypothetical protein G6F63_016326 [Rhizopus arrhizus]|nr:hypothetical protein G6F63_016326 [Rhizopus arrhizus]